MKLLVMMDARNVTGPARQLLAATPLLAQRGIETEFILATRGEAQTPYSMALEQAGYRVHRIHDRFPGDYRLLRQFRDVVHNVRPSVLQTHNYRGNTLARLSRGVTEVPWLAFFHGVTWENWKVRFYHRVDRWAMSKADRVVTVSQAQASVLRAQLPAGLPIEVIPNAVLLEPAKMDEHARQQKRSELGIPSDRLLLGVFGRFSKEKGQDLFLDAFDRVCKQRDNLSALLLGEGPMEHALRQQVRSLGMEHHLCFHGYQADIANYYALLDFLVIPSRSEGMPNVLLEAMSMGLPVVSTRVGGVAEVAIDGEHALIVEPERPELLAQAILRLADDPILRDRLGSAGKQRVGQAFSLQSRAEQLIHLYGQLPQ